LGPGLRPLAVGLRVVQPAQLGEHWLQAYLSAPVWRFAWAPGVVGPHWWFGVLMPSCDNVGRYFPLVIAHPRTQPPLDRIGLDHLDLWWSHMARAALDTLLEGHSLQAFEGTLHAAPPWPSAGPMPTMAPVSAVLAAAGGHGRQAVLPGATLGEMAHALAAGELQQRLAHTSFWWPLWPAGGAGSCTVVAGLPPPQAFANMLTGAW
jgi:type VI secretion system protein ImpM